MWRNTRKTRLFAVLAAIMLWGCAMLSGCSDKNYIKSEDRDALPVYKVSYGLLGEDELPVSVFFAPIGKAIKKENYQLLADAGVNTVMDFENWVTEDTAVVTKPLEYTSELGMSYFLQDMKVIGINNGYLPESAEDATFNARLDHYRTYSSFAGVYGKDEPVIEQLDTVKAGADLIRAYNAAKDANVIYYANMLPNWPFPIFSEVPNNAAVTYEMLLAAFCEKVQPEFLSFDRYPFEGEKGIKSGWFSNLALIRKYAQQHEIPFWGCVQTGGDFPDAPYIRQNTEAEFYWCINTLLAYGCQGLTFFPGVQPNAYNAATPGTVGLLDNSGEPTKYLGYATKISKQLNAAQKYIVNSVSQGVLAFGESPDTISSKNIPVLTEFRELTGVTGSGAALVGCFDYRGKTMLNVVANTFATGASVDIALHFSDNYGYSVVQGGVEDKMGGKTLSLKIPAGESVTVVLD